MTRFQSEICPLRRRNWVAHPGPIMPEISVTEWFEFGGQGHVAQLTNKSPPALAESI